MNDSFTYRPNEGELPVPRPAVRITVTYHNALHLPESIDITWEVNFPSSETIGAVVGQLLAAPREHRDRATAGG